MTFFLIEIIEGILLAILMTYNIQNHLLWGVADRRAMAM